MECQNPSVWNKNKSKKKIIIITIIISHNDPGGFIYSCNESVKYAPVYVETGDFRSMFVPLK
jgi:hypothetical protein